MASIHLPTGPATDPLELYRLRDGFYATDLLAAALVHLDFFSWLAEHPSSLQAICQELQLRRRPTDVMLTLFTAMDLIESKNGAFHLTTVGREHLVKSSPFFIGPYYAALKDRSVCLDYLNVLRTDQPANWGSYKNEKDWTRAMEDPGFATRFTAAMDCRGVYLGPAMARAVNASGLTRMLDVAGGSGIYACAMVVTHPHLVATVLEKPPVDQVARQMTEQRGFNERVSVIAGDMLNSEWPTEFDAHLISNVLHDWDEPLVEQLLVKSHRALAPGGLVIIHDAHLNEEKSGPLPVAKYSALLMHSTQGKCYSIGELRRYLTAAGFHQIEFTATAADRSIITARKPR
jgi:SAM-dependent methyltransferase